MRASTLIASAVVVLATSTVQGLAIPPAIRSVWYSP